jgi:thiamine-monophosphate kinase
MLMDGVHFCLDQTRPERVGAKALGVNLSDIAAMGGSPDAAFVALCLPRQSFDSLARPLMEGLINAAGEFGVVVAGGDTNTWEGPLVISVTVMGTPHTRGPVRRSGAQSGDFIFVTGNLGDSLGGRHLDFTPRVREVKAILDRVPLTAMIDLSDGLATDLRHILAASGVAGVLDRDHIPLAPGLNNLSREDALKRALTDGEDFELCFTLAPAAAQDLLRNNPIAIPLTPIGRIIPGAGLHWGHDSSPLEEIAWLGYQHI